MRTSKISRCSQLTVHASHAVTPALSFVNPHARCWLVYVTAIAFQQHLSQQSLLLLQHMHTLL